MSEESTFIHDLVTPLTIAQSHVRLLRAHAAKTPDERLASDAVASRLEKASEALERMVKIVADRRTLLSAREDE